MMLHESINLAAAAWAVIAQAPILKPPTPIGWTIMIVSVGSVLSLTAFCLVRVLSLPPVEEEYLKGPLEIDTRDTEDAD
ncbi:MAG: hypothetical protein WD066_05510 [Planctomycetaceae bacterium]